MKNIFTITILLFSLMFFNSKTFSQAGTLDQTFGNGGVILTTDEYSTGYASRIQDDGKIVVTGSGDNTVLLRRFNPDGSNDQIFGKDGLFEYAYGDINSYPRVRPGLDIAIQQDGKIVTIFEFDPNTSTIDIGVIRANANGTLDSTFGLNGLVTINIDVFDKPSSIILQPDGKIAISGDVRSSQYDQKRTFLLRLKADGSKDETFGNAGIVINNYSNPTTNRGLVIRPNGKLIMGVLYNINGSHSTYELQSFNTDGSVDVSYGTDGIAKFIFGEGQGGIWNTDLNAIAIQEDGKIVCTGTSGKDNEISMAVCRFNADGSVDETFGGNGGVITPYIWEPENYDITVQPDGKIITVGDEDGPDGQSGGKILLIRYNLNGELDPSFGDNGIATLTIDSLNGQIAKSVHLVANNKILITGNGGFNPDIFLARFNGDNVLAANFKDVKAAQNNNAITISWQTLNEDGTKSFTVKRSMNANDYVGISTVPAKGVASIYNYTDKNPLDGISYYRIKENAANGTNTFSPVVKVVFNSNGVISLYPNPAKNTVTVKGLNKNSKAVIKITDMQGREISSQNFTQSSSATLNIRALAHGTYFVQVAQQDKIVRLKLIKE